MALNDLPEATHRSKVGPDSFEAIWARLKGYSICSPGETEFKFGETVLFRELRSTGFRYTGRWVHVQIIHITKGGYYGLPRDLCVFGFRELMRSER